MSLTTFGLQDLIDLIVAGYSASADLPANVGVGSQFGPSFRASALAMLLLQNENIYINSISRLNSMQDPLPNGQPNPDVDTFINAFNFFRSGQSASMVYCTFSIASVSSSQTVVPVGMIVSPEAGPQFIVAPGGTGYNAIVNGYIIPAGQTTVSALTQCLVDGTQGNVLAGAINQVISGPSGVVPPVSFGVTNPQDATSPPNTPGVATEVGQPLFNRFALYMSGGGEGSPNSIMSAVPILANAPTSYGNVTFSYGDLVQSVFSGGKWHFTPGTAGWFTLIVNIINSPSNPPGGLLTQIATGLLTNYRSGGVNYNVIGPNLLKVDGSGVITVAPGFASDVVVAAVAAAFTAFVNGIGLNQTGGSTVCSLMAAYVAISQVPGVLFIDGLQLNKGTNDVTAPFGSQLIAGKTVDFTAS